AKRRLDGAAGIGQEVGNTRQGLVLLRIKDMQDRADQQAMAGLFPVIALVERAFGIDQYIRDVLHVADFPFPLPDLQQGVVGRRSGVGRIEQQHAAMLRAEARRQRPVLTLYIIDDAASRPGQQRRDYQSDPLAAAGRGEAKDVLRAVMAQIIAFVLAKHHAIWAKQSGGADFPVLRPSCRTVGGDVARFPRPDDRHEDGGGDGEEAAGCRDDRALDEDRGRICIEGKPPPEEGRRIIDRPARQLEPRLTKLRLEAKAEHDPLRRRPGHRQNDSEDDGNLTPKDSASAQYRLQPAREMEPIKELPSLRKATANNSTGGCRMLWAAKRTGCGVVTESNRLQRSESVVCVRPPQSPGQTEQFPKRRIAVVRRPDRREGDRPGLVQNGTEDNTWRCSCLILSGQERNAKPVSNHRQQGVAPYIELANGRNLPFASKAYYDQIVHLRAGPSLADDEGFA